MPHPASDPTNLLLGKGIIYFDRFDATGLRTGELDLGNCEVFSVGITDENKEKYSSRDAAAGLLRRVNTRRDIPISIQGDEFNPENLALVQMGSLGTLTQASGSVTAEQISAAPVKGRWYPTVGRDISAVVVKQGVTTLALDTDYLVDAVSGRIYLVPSGAAVAGTPLTVDYAAAAITGLDTVAAGTASIIEGYIHFMGDPSAGPIMEAEYWRVSISVGGDEVGLITDDWGNWSLEAKVLADTVNHPTEPFGRTIFHGYR